MRFLNSMQNRYTTKKYDPSKAIDSEKIEELKKILQLTPSSINSQPWKFTFVTDKETKAKLAEASYINDAKILACDTLVVFSRIDNLDLFESLIEEEMPEGALGYYKNVLKPQPKNQITAWFDKQVYIALGVFLSACAEMGIDSTPMEGVEPAKYDAILNQEDYTTLVAVAIGHRADDDTNQPSITPKSRRDINKVIESV